MFDFSAFFAQYGNLFLQGTVDTLIMTCVATILAYVIGIPLGILLVVTSPNGLRPNRIVSTIVGWIVNIGRSVPFIILLVALIPFTRFIVGTSLGVPGAVVPLVVTAAPFAARMVEQSLEETDSGLVEAAQSFGASTWQIVWKVYLKETLPSLVRGAAITFVTLFGYSAMAGTVGAGGLGDIAIRYGYQRFQTDVMIFAVLLCVVLVIVFQAIGDVTARKIDKRRRYPARIAGARQQRHASSKEAASFGRRLLRFGRYTVGLNHLPAIVRGSSRYSPGKTSDSPLDYDPVAVVNLMLNDLRLEARKRLFARCERFIEIGDPDALVARAGPHALKRQTAFLGLVLTRRLDDFRVVHEHRAACARRHDDALAHTDHVRREPHAFVRVRSKRVE